ncbi:sulfotransferase [Lysobacter concretionis Ko07 = DSM 16239]|uniref:Sulfotransferase n=1 Tax=Lysobacter concretionis Ko07 = DSM 16239 TaxID=1122185 RepID=A0A0A0ES47_9GAMM|nr:MULTISPECIES: sulfotransferase [Lysobacter]KGM51977.1 sulfotransferase [Lysobacter concretionis Ko07 = DSM 16239]QOD90282.1 sulfotransferase [Lysobacter sp. CW239]
MSRNQAVQWYAQAVEALNRGHWTEAAQMADRLLKGAPEHPGVHFVAGVAALQQKQIPHALGHLQRAASLNPKRSDYAAQYARALAAGRLVREAVIAAEQAMSLSPSDPLTLDTLGVVFTQANAHTRAVEAFRQAAALMPDAASYRFNLATSLTFSGDLEGAEREYEACIALEPRYWKAHLGLAQLRKQTTEHHHLNRLRSLLEQFQGDDSARLYLNLALAKELEDLRDYVPSFEHLKAGKAAGGAGRKYSIARDEALFEAVTRSFGNPAQVSAGSQSEEPIFVIGMPRSGTTLVDRILSSHSSVHSAGELQNFGVLLKRASGSRTPSMMDPDTVSRAMQVDWTALGDAYVASTRPGTGHTARFIDKLPHNFLYAGFIARALPRAKIICLRREPTDTCLGNFRQLFSQSSPYYDYSFDLMDTGRYYLLFDRLMAHWQRVLPGRIFEFGYEELVDSQERSTRRLLEFCELPWEDTCLYFEKNQSPVATASAVQVREPINRKSLQRWKHYEGQMTELRKLLKEGGAITD